MIEACVIEERLKENVSNLKLLYEHTTMEDLKIFRPQNRYEPLDVEKGFALIRNLDQNEVVQIVDFYAQAGTVFQAHEHPGYEFIIVYEGLVELSIIQQNKTYRIGPAAHKTCFYWDGRKPHRGYFHENTRMYAVTIPPDRFWPKD